MLTHGLEDFLQLRSRSRRHCQPCVTWVFAAMPDPYVMQLKLSSQRDNLIEDLGKQQTVDDVPRDLDLLAECPLGRL